MNAKKIIEMLAAEIAKLIDLGCTCDGCKELIAACDAARRMLGEQEASIEGLINVNGRLRGDLKRGEEKIARLEAESVTAKMEVANVRDGWRRDRNVWKSELNQALDREKAREAEVDTLKAELSHATSRVELEREVNRAYKAEIEGREALIYSLQAELSGALEREKVREAFAGSLKKPEVTIHGLMIDLTLAGEHIIVTQR